MEGLGSFLCATYFVSVRDLVGRSHEPSSDQNRIFMGDIHALFGIKLFLCTRMQCIERAWLSVTKQISPKEKRQQLADLDEMKLSSA